MLTIEEESPLKTLQKLIDNYDKDIVRMVNGISMEIQKFYANSKNNINEFSKVSKHIENQTSLIKHSLNNVKQTSNVNELNIIPNYIESILTKKKFFEQEINTFKENINNYFQRTKKYIQYLKTQRDKLKKERELIEDTYSQTNSPTNQNKNNLLQSNSLSNSQRQIQAIMKNVTNPTILESIENNSSSKSPANSSSPTNSSNIGNDLISLSKKVIEFLNEMNSLQMSILNKDENISEKKRLFELMKFNLYKQAEQCSNINSNVGSFSVLASSINSNLKASIVIENTINNINVSTNTSFNYEDKFTKLTDENNSLHSLLNSYTAQIQEQENIISKLNNNNSDNYNKLLLVKEKNKTLENNISTLNNNLTQLLNEKESILNEYKNTNTKYKNEIEGYKKEINKYEQMLSSAIENENNLICSVDKEKAEIIKAYTDKIDKLNADNIELQNKIIIYQNEIKSLTIQKKQLNENNNKHSIHLKHLTDVNADLTKQIEQSRNKETELSQVIKSQKQKLYKTSLYQQNTNLQQQHLYSLLLSPNNEYKPSQYHIVMDKTFGKLAWYLLFKKTKYNNTTSIGQMMHDVNVQYEEFIWVPSSKMHFPLSDYNTFESEEAFQNLINQKIHKYIEDILTYQNKLDKLNAEIKRLKSQNQIQVNKNTMNSYTSPMKLDKQGKPTNPFKHKDKDVKQSSNTKENAVNENEDKIIISKHEYKKTLENLNKSHEKIKVLENENKLLLQENKEKKDFEDNVSFIKDTDDNNNSGFLNEHEILPDITDNNTNVTNNNTNNLNDYSFIKIKQSELESKNNKIRDLKTDLIATRQELKIIKTELKETNIKLNNISNEFRQIIETTSFSQNIKDNVISLCKLCGITYTNYNNIR